MAEGLKLILGAETKQAEQALKNFSGSLTKLEQDVQSFGGGVKTFTNTFNAGFTKLPVAIKKTETALARLPKSSNAATLSLINLGRVAQDAPFGIIGIANNINPLLESFQRLKAESGSTGTALKSLGASLIGGGGLGLAVSVITGLMSFFALRSRDAKSEVEKTSKAVEEAKKKQQEFQQALDQAAGSVVSQAGELTALKNILTDVSNNYLVLTDAIVKQGIAQFLFSQKEGLVQKALSEAIRNNLKAQQSSLKFRQSEFKVAEKTSNLKPIRFARPEELKKAGLTLNATEKQLFDINKLAADLGLSFEEFVKVPDKNKKSVDDFIDRAKKLAEELRKIGFLQPEFSFFDSAEEELTKARKVFDDFNAKRFRLDPDFFKLDTTFNVPREEIERALNSVEEGIQKGIIERGGIQLVAPISITTDFSQNAALVDEFKRVFEAIGQSIPPLDLSATAGFNRNVLVQQLRDFFQVGQNVTEEGVIGMAQEFEKGMDRINSTLSNFAVQGVTSFAESFGGLFAGGDLRDIFSGFVNVVADGLSAIGKQMIALSPVITALKAALKSLNPSVLLPAGIALVSIGAALRATVGKGVTGFAQGGLVFGPTMGLVGEGIGTSRSNPEVIAPLDQLKGMLSEFVGGGVQRVHVTGRLRGRDMALQNARTSRSQRRVNG